MKNPFLEELARLARISPATCAHEGSPANNENVMAAMQTMIGTLCQRLTNAMDDIDTDQLPPNVRAHLRSYLTTWEAAKAKQAARQTRIETAEEAASNG